MFTSIQKLLYLLGLSLFIALSISSCKPDEENDTVGPDSPVLDSVSLEGEHQLKLFGKFGNDPGAESRSVLVNDIAVTTGNILNWNTGTITCYIDTETEGEVIVVVRGRKGKGIKFTRTVAGAPRITYLETNETENLLYIYGFGFGNPDQPAPKITIENEVIDEIETVGGVELRGDRLIVCRIPPFGPGSSGKVVVTKGGKSSAPHILNEWNGVLKFQRPQTTPSAGNLMEEVSFKIRLRGDASPIPSTLQPIRPGSSLNMTSVAEYSGHGKGHSTYTAEGCASVDIDWTTTNGTLILSPNDWDLTLESHFQAEVENKVNGFDLKIDFDAQEVINTKIITTTCNGSVDTRNDKWWITYHEFENETIPLVFDGNKIKAGKLSKSNLSSGAGLVWNAEEEKTQRVTATLEWDEITAKYE
jgi:hypothetical protein